MADRPVEPTPDPMTPDPERLDALVDGDPPRDGAERDTLHLIAALRDAQPDAPDALRARVTGLAEAEAAPTRTRGWPRVAGGTWNRRLVVAAGAAVVVAAAALAPAVLRDTDPRGPAPDGTADVRAATTTPAVEGEPSTRAGAPEAGSVPERAAAPATSAAPDSPAPAPSAPVPAPTRAVAPATDTSGDIARVTARDPAVRTGDRAAAVITGIRDAGGMVTGGGYLSTRDGRMRFRVRAAVPTAAVRAVRREAAMDPPGAPATPDPAVTAFGRALERSAASPGEDALRAPVLRALARVVAADAAGPAAAPPVTTVTVDIASTTP